ncbi:MAG: hypothetical protein AAB870_04040 [Patescibacteria group bacterium]
MPLVLVSRDPKQIPDELLLHIGKHFPSIVANNLTVPEVPAAHLDATDVEIRFSDFSPFDVKKRPLEIVVFANDFLERKVDLEERTRQIDADLRESFSIIKSLNNFWVWILLMPGAFLDVTEDSHFEQASKIVENWPDWKKDTIQSEILNKKKG